MAMETRHIWVAGHVSFWLTLRKMLEADFCVCFSFSLSSLDTVYEIDRKSVV